MRQGCLLLLILLSGKLLTAQTAVTNTGTLYISGGSDIFYAGSNFTNNSGSALTNNGQLYIKGNLSNAQLSMAIGTGILYLNGSAAQAVNGSQPFRTYHLNTNNSSGITLNNNLSVSGIHTFVDGIITTSATPNYLIYEAGSSYAGDGDTRHVNGWVKKFGSTNFVFPVGDGTVERTVALNSLSANSEFDVKYVPTTPHVYQTQTPLWTVDKAEHWSIQKISGGTASVTMNWNYSKVYFPNFIIADIRAAGYDGSLWVNDGGSATGNAATTGTITSSIISSFNLFTFGSVSYSLPLSLVNFTATRINNYTAITWTTEGEYRADHFEVERSDDGLSFYPISRSPARNRGITELYNARDNALVNRIAYFRLRSVDKDGKATVSRVVSVNVSNPNDFLNLLINPVHDQVSLAAGSQLNGVFNYRIHAFNGQLVQEGKLNIQNGGQYTIPLKRIPEPGAYTLEVSNGTQKFRFKLVMQ